VDKGVVVNGDLLVKGFKEGRREGIMVAIGTRVIHEYLAPTKPNERKQG